MATELQQSLLDSMQLLSQKSLEKSKYPNTIKATIVEVLDSATYRYLIKYGDNSKIEAISSSNASYQVGDNVYVLIPEGDLSKTNIILGAAVPYAALYASSDESDTYIEITNSLIGKIKDINLRSWETHLPTDEESQIDINVHNFGLVFKNYLENYNNFIFTAKVKTEIDKYHQIQGNYGLILKLPFYIVNADGSQTPTWKVCRMDVDSMLGNPYNYSKEQLINLYYNIPEGWVYDSAREPELSSFVGGFGYSTPRTDIDYDIHFSEIGLKMIDTLTESDKTGYYLSLVSTGGNYFLSGSFDDNKILTPKLKVNGKDALVTTWDCYWFEEDGAIKTDSEDYLSLGGLGWRCINDKTYIGTDDSGKPIYQYVTTNYTCSVSENDVPFISRYKCILTKGDIVVSGVITLKNLNSTIDLDLRTSTGSTTFVENIGDINLISRIYYPTVTDQDSEIAISYSWQRFDKNGNYIDDDFYSVVRYNDKTIQIKENEERQVFETEISYPCYLLDEKNLIKCTFYSTITKNGTTTQYNLGTASILVTTEVQYGYKLSLFNGDVLYKYDADGDSPLIADYDGPISSRVKNIQPISFKIFKEDGSELNESEYRFCSYTWRIPKNSMISLPSEVIPSREDEDYYYIEGTGKNDLNYKIANLYNKRLSDNDIALFVKFSEIALNAVASIKFLKDGESGTNGTRYSAVIGYRENAGEQSYSYGERDADGRVRKLQFIYVADEQKWYRYGITNDVYSSIGTPQLNLALYADGENITSQTDRYSYEWEMFDAVSEDKTTSNKTCFSIGKNNGIISSLNIPWSNANEIYTNVARVKVTIKKNTSDTDTVHQNIIYAYYPIEITWISSKSIEGNEHTIPTLVGGFDQVLYDAGGTNPEYDSSTYFECSDNKVDDTSGYYQYNWSASNNLTVSSSHSYKNKIIPVNKFNNGNSNNFVKVVLSMSDENIQALQGEKRKAEEGAAAAQKQINFYNRNKNNILAFVQLYDESTYKNKLNQSAILLKARGDCIQFIDTTLFSTIQELEEYCVEKGVNILDFNYISYCSIKKNILSQAKKTLYQLLSVNELSDISDLSNAVFEDISAQIDAIRNRNGYAIADKIDQLVKSWNREITVKYKNLYNNLMAVKTGEVDNLHSFTNELNQLLTNSHLLALTREYEGIKPEQEFLNLYSQLQILIKNLKEVNGKYITKYSLDNDLLAGIQKLLAIYKDTSYQEQYYKKIIDSYTERRDNYTNAVNSYSKALMPSSSSFIVHIKPIIMLFNTYELSYLNGWDGNKLYTDETNGQYIIAPQMGAGTKSADGRFTGITMGVRNFAHGSNKHIGLFGYSNGVQSLFLNAKDGSAIFGKSGIGQITIDPSQSKALIYSSNYFKNYNLEGKPTSYNAGNLSGAGMLIDLTTPEIRFGNGNFVVNSNGHLTAKGGGSIAGWSIGNTTLSAEGITINANGSISGDGVGGKTWAINRGTAVFNNATITGTITTGNLTATGGKIGGCTIDGDGIWSGSGANIAGLGRYGARYAFWAGSSDSAQAPFRVGHDGSLVASKANITGSITASSGTIAGWNINETTLSKNGITIDSSGAIYGTGFTLNAWGLALSNPNGASTLNWGDNFSVGVDGTLVARNATFGGNVAASSLSIDNGAGGYIHWYGSNNHPTVSGLNVGGGGINLHNNAGISGITTCGRGSSVWTFHTDDSKISTGADITTSGSIGASGAFFGNLELFIVGGDSLQNWLAKKANKGTYDVKNSAGQKIGTVELK